MFFKIVILKNFTNFTAKHLRWLLLKLNILMHQLPIQLDIRIGSVNWNESYQKETKHSCSSCRFIDLLHIRIGNLDLCKCGHCQNEARETDCLCRKEVDRGARGKHLAMQLL